MADKETEIKPSFSLVKVDLDLKAPSQVVEKLIDSVSRGLGLVYAPTHLKRLAKSCIEVETSLAESSNETHQLFLRSLGRSSGQETRRQQNIEAITQGAINELPMLESAQSIEEDWIAHFFEQCSNISDKEMQSLWSRILAGEASSPGTFSRRTLSFIKTLEKSEASVFTEYCRYLFQDELGGPPYRVSIGNSNDYLEANGMPSHYISHLENIGLVNQGLCSRDSITKRLELNIRYFDRKLSVTKEDDQILGKVYPMESLTALGRELYPIAGTKPDYSYVDEFLKCAKDDGFQVVE